MLVISASFLGVYSQHSRSDDLAGKELAEDGQFKDLLDRYSYAYGADLAERYKAEGIELNAAVLAAGMQDVYGGGEKRMSAGEVAATIELYLKLHRQKKEEERAALGEKNKIEGEAFLAENATKEGVVVTASGLQYKVLTEGGGKRKPAEDDIVTVHYRGSFIDGTEFDSTYQRNEVFTAKVRQLIEGWGEALQLMSEGAKWELYIPADIAYGEQGSEPYIRPNAVLIFEVELLEIEKES